MLEFAALTYTMLASFIFSSADRNRRAARPNHRMVEHVGWALVALSLALALLFGARLLLMLLRG